MAVFVDNMSMKFGQYVMSHMIADTSDELLAMVDQIGVSRKWIQQAGTGDEHFDICLSKRARAVRCGARQVTLRQLASMVIARRKTGQLCAPEVAEEQAKAFIRKWAGCSKCGKRTKDHAGGGVCA